MARPKLTVEEVWILEEVLPYEGGTIVGVFITAEAAQADRPYRWWKLPEGGGFTTNPHNGGPGRQDPYFVINPYPVRTK